MIELKAPVKAAVDYSLTSRSRHTNRKKQHHRLKSARPQEGICYIVAGRVTFSNSSVALHETSNVRHFFEVDNDGKPYQLGTGFLVATSQPTKMYPLEV